MVKFSIYLNRRVFVMIFFIYLHKNILWISINSASPLWRNKNNISTFWLKNVPYLELSFEYIYMYCILIGLQSWWLSRMLVQLMVIRRSQVWSLLDRQHSYVENDPKIYFLPLFSPFHSFKKGSCQFLAKECAQVLVNYLEDKACQKKKKKMRLGKLIVLDLRLTWP